MTIKECRTRKNRFKKIIDKLERGELSKLSDEDINALELAVMRSIAIEDLNISELKERAKNENKGGLD